MTKIKIKNYITDKEKEELWIKSKILIGKMYDRQKDFKSINRRKKIYLGLISELIFEKWFKENYPEKKIKKWEKEGIDKYDFLIEDNIYIDIKSSKEKSYHNIDNFENFILNNRNFTLPIDQVKKEFINKNYYIIQILYDNNFEHCYISNGIKLNKLINPKNYRKLKLDNNNFQETYMTLLKNEEKTFLNFNNKFNIAVVGTRTFNDFLKLEKILGKFIKSLIDKKIINDKNEIRIVSGGAKGTDSLARKYAELNNIEILEILPNWDKYGKKAGFIRNYEIWKNSDVGLGFWDGKSKGTGHSIKIAKDMKKDLIMYIYTNNNFNLYNNGNILNKIIKKDINQISNTQIIF